MVALLGPNGAGKTTTLLAIAGLLRPLAGDVLLDGKSLRGRRPWWVSRQGVALVPEGRCLFTQLTAGENLLLATTPRGPSKGAILQHFPALEPLLGRKAGLLSGGEQQMLAIARSLLTGPRFLLIDELSLGLAPLVTESLLGSLRQMTEQLGLGVLVVEQHVAVALRAAARGYVFQRGQVVLQGSGSDLRRADKELVSAYLGSRCGPDA